VERLRKETESTIESRKSAIPAGILSVEVMIKISLVPELLENVNYAISLYKKMVEEYGEGNVSHTVDIEIENGRAIKNDYIIHAQKPAA
jgi:hypothetical protein